MECGSGDGVGRWDWIGLAWNGMELGERELGDESGRGI